MNVEIAQRLAELRRERGFSQEDLASRLGLSRQAVSKWERAESAPDMGNLIALADLYEVTIDELLRVSPEVEEDMLFESQERAESAETAAAEAADAAREAASRAEAAAAAAEDASEPAKVVVEVNAPQVAGAPGMPSNAGAPGGPMGGSAGAPPHGAPQGFGPGSGHQGPWVPPHVAGHQGFHGPTGPGPQQPIPPASSVPITPAPQQPPKDPLRSFPYPLLCAVVFLLIGFFFGWWHPGWIIFLTIPFYYWIVNVLENDPGFQEWRYDRAQAAAELRAMSAALDANSGPAPSVGQPHGGNGHDASSPNEGGVR